MWSPDPSCRKCEHRPAGNAALWSAQLVFLTTHFCGGPRNLPASGEAPSTSEACGWTSDYRTSREQEINDCDTRQTLYVPFDLQHLGNTSLSALNLPVAGAVHGLECKDVIFHREGEHVFTVVLPVARCLPQFAVIDVGGGYFLKASSPVLILEKTTKPHKQVKPPAGLHRYFIELSWIMDYWHDSRATAKEIGSCGFYLSFCFP